MIKPGVKSRRDVEDTIVRRALGDDEFRAALLVDPRSAVERILSEEHPGAKLAAGLAVNVIEEAPNTLTLVVPAVQELSEGQLEEVSGGIRIGGVPGAPGPGG